ncbi:ATP-binding cassette domain-containing protein [Dermacoccus nishinomiyaensis]|uniref:ABC transporter ATP-binding protein n=1 Tax=Dermacoccus nishinomiyaensis TaxID=1274 RepID=A0A075JDA3_9MICO|nr:MULTISPECIES: ATP-binding cassette domain-containing protein [Dermacoccus]AIF39929.1 ABC transporter ATP-binding protein [Dermacoccus nishinomiyaensis]MBO1757887.1 ATP-binding cassette domain-containing protein [Dermacoccus sp. NHGro5]QQY25132.1 ATP-binding cassette domain-containing protein [Dermacoccus nishinomiyaensis]
MLEARGLTRRFGDKTAVDDVSFEVADGQMTGFIGGNGAGKTTTMRMIMGVLEPSAGEALWNGEPMTREHRRRIGYMPEERGLYPKQPLIDQLVYLAQLRGVAPAAARARGLELLERFGLGDRAKDKLEALSLGNQQRVQIAASVIAEPDALILDEPFSGLDPRAVDAMADLLREFTSRGVPVLFSSHQLDLVERLCDSLVFLAGGRVAAQGTAAQLRRSGRVRHRLVLDSDAGWVRDVADRLGIGVVDVDGPRALLELPDDAEGRERASDELLRTVMARASIREYAEVLPQLADIYREVA